MSISSVLILILVAISPLKAKKYDVSAEVDDILKSRPGEMSLNYDPFFTSSFSMIPNIPYVDAEPDFTYDSDHVSASDVDLPEKNDAEEEEEGQESAPRRSEAIKMRKPLDRKTFFEEDPFATHENLEEEPNSGDKKRKWKKKKGGKKGKRPTKKPGGGEMYKREMEQPEKNDDSDEVDYKYSIDFEPSDEYQRIKAISDKQREDLTKNPENCKVYKSDGGQTCYECLDPHTGDTSESCTYDDDHSPAKYAYETSKSYNDKDHVPQDEDFENNYGDDSEETTTVSPKKSLRPYRRPKKSNHEARNPRGAKKFEALRTATTKKPPKKEEDYYYDDGDADADTYYDTSYDAEVLEPYKHSFYFSAPHKTHEEVKKAQEPTYSPIYDAKTDVDSALKDFNTRDWSSCKKKTKGDLTCYQCEDEKGVQHEDCMFVQESRPASVRVVYKGPKRVLTTTPAGSTTFATTQSTFKYSEISTSTQKPIEPVTISSTLPIHSRSGNLKVVPKLNRQKTKKIVIVKRKKPEKKPTKNNEDDEDSSEEVIEKRTIKRRIKVTLKGNNGTMPANYTNRVLHDDMKDFKI